MPEPRVLCGPPTAKAGSHGPGLCFLPWGSSDVGLSRGFQKSIEIHRISVEFPRRFGRGDDICVR